VVFFETPETAEAAGFRACRRCRPQISDRVDPWAERVRRACVYLANVPGHVPLAALARRLGGSPYQLQRNFKRLVGLSPREWAEAHRLQQVKRELRRGKDVTSAMLDAGYSSSGRFYERAATRLGMRPNVYRRGGTATVLRFTIVDSTLGRVLVAATSRGICSIAIGDSDRELENGLRREYPAATIEREASGESEWTGAIVRHIADGRPKRLDVPLDIQATAFQWQVWQALTAIPYGETRSYGEVAAAIGRPSAARAVARACAANPVALAIPCHRVVPASGGVGGYRWGAGRKRQLLDREGSARSK
jgi:AraC family transcriptional regulator of adaptative response/methylated-DNA-[protein]-cysteine methyltransferase